MRVNFHKVKEALENIKNTSSYYCGSTLFIDLEDHPSVGLNLTGRGFSFGFNGVKEQKFIMTKEMQKLVQDIYKKYKLDNGRRNQEYFDERKV